MTEPERSDSPSTIERLPLEHPLPQEIIQMERDDTVCKFCGVSYLIHHEVKRLEKELEKVNAELVKYKGCEEREKTLKTEVEKLREMLSDKDKILSDKTASIEHLKSSIKVKEDEIWKAVQQAETAQRQLEAGKEENDKLRQWKKDVRQRLPLLKSSISDQRTPLRSVRSELKGHQDMMAATSGKLLSIIQKVCRKEKQVVDGILSRATDAEKLAASLQDQLKEAQAKIASSSAQGQRLQDVEGRLQQVEGRYKELQTREQKLQDELQRAVTEARSAKAEAVQFKELLRNKSLEVEDSQRQRAKQEQFLTNSINKLQDELRSRAEEAQDRQRELKQLKDAEAERKRRLEATVSTKMEATAKELRQLQDALESARRDSSALRDEREAMVTSHQHRIEQLKESFAQRIQNAEGWPEKLNEMISKERERHAKEMASLEEKLQKAFQVDLEIQKQRNDELVLKYKQELDSAEAKLKSALQRDRESLKVKLESLERELSESRRLAAGQEKALREEINSLQRVIAELRKQLAHGDAQNDNELQTLKAELREAEQDLAQIQQDKKSLERRLDHSKEEIGLLQETVHKECEERYELTEALSKAKEELLVHHRGSAIAKNGGGPSAPSRSHSQLSLGGRDSNQKLMSSSPQSPLQPASPKSGSSQGGVGGSFRRGSGGGGLTSGGGSGSPMGSKSSKNRQGNGGGGGGSLSDSRNRIASVLGKKELKIKIDI